MCGILAVLSHSPRGLPPDSRHRATRALAAIRHRGPNASVVHIDEQNQWVLGHVRLSIIDIGPASNQPFWSACGRYALVFNGEIYNYIELREELMTEGVEFFTNSDSEVLLQALIHWGNDAIARLNGMWAFVMLDRHEGAAVVSRDRWGVKPMYVHRTPDHTVIASEAKAILAYEGRTFSPNRNAIVRHLRYTIGGESTESWFEEIERFPAAHWQVVPVAGSQQHVLGVAQPLVRYWIYPSEESVFTLSDAVDHVDELLSDAVKIRLRSDVPVALSLSGGLDSSIIAWLVGQRYGQSLEAFTAWHGAREKSELPVAEDIANRFGHRLTPIAEANYGNTMELVEHCVYHLDSGHGATAIVPYYQLCKAARRTAAVMLEGQGADESFGGYTYMLPMAATDYLLRLRPLQAGMAAIVQLYADGVGPTFQSWAKYLFRHIYERQYLTWGHRILPRFDIAPGADEFLRIRLASSNLREQCVVRHRTGLANLLQYGDAISMSVNLETLSRSEVSTQVSKDA